MRVWLPDQDKVWVQGEVVRGVREDFVEVRCEGEEAVRVLDIRPPNQPLLCNPKILVGGNDLTALSYLHEPAGQLTNHIASNSRDF